MRSDCHIHVRGDETSDGILRAMDDAKLDLVCILSRPPAAGKADQLERSDSDDDKRMAETALMGETDPQRIRTFFWLDPRAADACDQVDRAFNQYNYDGIKFIPDHWFPYEDRFRPVYAKIEEFKKPILWHTGILWANADSSRFCRPVNLEIMQDFPGVPFMMGHVSWPWTDECIAVADRFKTMARKSLNCDPELARDVALRHINLHDSQYEVPVQCKLDLTQGAPPVYRSKMLRIAYEVLGVDMLIFGTDAHGAEDLSGVKLHQDRDEKILREELKLSESDIDRIMGTNVLSMFGGS